MSKWILIHADNNSIELPDVFESYEEAYRQMKLEYDKIVEEGDDADIDVNYASIQTDYENFDWRIFEVKF